MGTFQSGIGFKKGILTNGAPLPGADYISSFAFYNSTPPVLWPVGLIKQCFGIQDMINCGITGKSEDETQSTFTYLVTAGASGAGDTISIYAQEPINPANNNPSPNLILLFKYITVAGDTVVNTLAANINTAFNANAPFNGGYSSTVVTATVTGKARKGLGLFPNTGTPYTVVITGGAITGTLTQNVIPGVASKFDRYFYHVSEFFRIDPKATCWVGIFPTGVNTFAESQTLQTAASGSIRQIGFYRDDRTHATNYATDQNTLNAICQTLDDNKMPLSAVLVENMAAISDLSTLADQSLLNNEWISSCIGQDGSGQGFALWKASGISISCLGAMLGTISAAQVNECIGNPIPKFNISNGTENAIPAFANGQLFSAIAFGLQTQLDNQRWNYTGTFTGYNGTYFSNDNCNIAANSNYAYISQNRIQAKIERILYIAYLPFLKANDTLNADGTLANTSVVPLESVGDNALAGMITANELSGEKVLINPTQNILTSGKLVVTLYNQNNGISRQIEIVTNSVTQLP
jgi:hypothetical protein